MKKIKGLILFCAVFLGTSLSLGQNHLLITEFVVTPTAGEFIEIYNPGPDSVDLTNYYITDGTHAGSGTYYYNIVTGASSGGGSFGDWHARFPAGAKIGPGEYQTISLSGNGNFLTTYGVEPTYELFEDNAGTDVPDMLEATPGSINGQGGLTNDGEFIVLFYWDGASDLVQDIDYLVYGDKNEAVDKTGVEIDGPDAGTETSTYQNDTPIDDQTVVNVENDDDEHPHDGGSSAQRVLPVEDVETWTGGNGMTGHDETSENTSWKGGIWSLHTTPTPNAPALGDSLSIQEVNFVRAADIEATGDDSPFLGDTLTVTGIFMQGPREVFLGSRWGGFIQDERGGPWSGFFVIQHDTTSPGVDGTLITSVETGDKIRVKGRVAEFPAGAPSISQFELFFNPVEPIEFVEFGVQLPDTVLLTPGDLGLTQAGNSADPALSERWEGVFARFEGLTVLANDLPGNTMTAFDETGTIILDDYFNAVNQVIAANNNAWPGFPPGTKINVNGFIRGGTSSGNITVNPRVIEDIEVASAPPEITNLSRDPVIPTSADAVTVSAVIEDAQTTVASANLHYSVDGGAYQQMAMTTNGGSIRQASILADSLYSAAIPAQGEGSFVEYFLTAVDDTGDSTSAPGDTSSGKFFYTVRDGGATIADVQFTPFSDGNSSLRNLDITVSGIATTDSSDMSFYFIQDGTEPWSGLWINDNNNNFALGDEVEVTGTVNEFFSATQLTNVTSAVRLSEGNIVPAPLDMKTGDITTGAPGAEQYEGMLVRVNKVAVINEFPDTGNFGEFTIDDGSGEVRVDDVSSNFRGQLDSAFVAGDSLESVTGILHYTFGNFKIEPRNDDDVVRIVTSVNDIGAPLTYKLHQNYPNPFNPETTIQYEIANKGQVTLHIYNLMGQRVRTLVDKVQPAGNFVVRWDGTSDRGLKVASGIYFYRFKSGDFTKKHKMLLLK